MIPKRFWDKVDVVTVDECWNWTGATGGGKKALYGKFWYNGKMIGSHRYVMIAIHGSDYVEDKQVRHKCDNPSCVNPTHLEIGTHQDNMDDRSLRGGKCKDPKFRYIMRKRKFGNDIDSMITRAQELKDSGYSPSEVSTITGLDASLFQY